MEAGVEQRVAQFVWDEFQPYYFAPLTPYPEDRPVGEMRIDGDDLSDMVTTFEKKFDRKHVGKWVGPDDPTLLEFAVALTNSTREA
jgi:hypothetical protein